jgi:tetratricopeptide (TPR) repeat protein
MTKALPELEKAAVADSGWAEPQMYLGYVHFRMGESEKAGASLEKASLLDPERAEIAWLRGYLLVAEERVDDAIALLQGIGLSGPSPPVPGAAADSSGAVESAPEPAEAGTGAAQEGADGSLDLSETLALRDAGKTDEAGKALEELLAGALGEAGFTMKKKKMSATEKMKLMMQKDQGQ